MKINKMNILPLGLLAAVVAAAFMAGLSMLPFMRDYPTILGELQRTESRIWLGFYVMLAIVFRSNLIILASLIEGASLLIQIAHLSPLFGEFTFLLGPAGNVVLATGIATFNFSERTSRQIGLIFSLWLLLYTGMFFYVLFQIKHHPHEWLHASGFWTWVRMGSWLDRIVYFVCLYLILLPKLSVKSANEATQ